MDQVEIEHTIDVVEDLFKKHVSGAVLCKALICSDFRERLNVIHAELDDGFRFWRAPKPAVTETLPLAAPEPPAKVLKQEAAAWTRQPASRGMVVGKGKGDKSKAWDQTGVPAGYRFMG